MSAFCLGRWGSLLAILALSAGCLCDSEVRERVPNPGKTREAVNTLESCGATTAFVTSITIRPLGLRALFTRDAVAFSTKSENPVWLSWTDDTHLAIRYRAEASEVYQRNERAGGVEIAYATYGPERPAGGGDGARVTAGVADAVAVLDAQNRARNGRPGFP